VQLKQLSQQRFRRCPAFCGASEPHTPQGRDLTPMSPSPPLRLASPKCMFSKNTRSAPKNLRAAR
jgi:hypothetical protein